MNFFGLNLVLILGVAVAGMPVYSQEGLTTTARGADSPSEFPVEELAATALTGALSEENRYAGAGLTFLEANFGISRSGAENILAVLRSQAERATDSLVRLREYCVALSNATSRPETLKVIQTFYAEDIEEERARGTELLESLNSEDLAKVTEILVNEIRPAATKTTTNLEAMLDQRTPTEYRKSVCELANKASR